MARPVEVRTRIDKEGNLIPLECTFGDKKVQVIGVGRRWQTEDGEHLLVMLPGDKVVELLHHLDDTWALVKDHSPQKGKFI